MVARNRRHFPGAGGSRRLQGMSARRSRRSSISIGRSCCTTPGSRKRRARTVSGAVVDGDDVAFPLDALGGDEAIDYVGLDWYPPMADWRDGESHADAA